MPEMNGIEVLREIRRRGWKTRVILFSSQTTRGAEAALAALREGADDIVAKPSGDQQSFEDAAKGIETTLVPKVLQFSVGELKETKIPKGTYSDSTAGEAGTQSSGVTLIPAKDLRHFSK
jgi:chemotaxis response regulator CheB